jgi:hypothetical protein
MPDKERHDLIEHRHAFRMAALRSEPELSGLSQSMHAHYTEMEIATRFPNETAGIAAAAEAAELASTALRAASAAVENELKSVNAPLSEPAPPAVSKPWA